LVGAVILYTSKLKIRLADLARMVALTFVVLYSFYFYFYNVKTTNSLKFLNWTEINYSIGKINIYDWVRLNFTKMNNVIVWCDGGEGKDFVNLARFDPDLIWFDHDGLMRVFLIRCRYNNPNVETDDIDKILGSAVENKQKFWISSSNKCINDADVKAKYSYEMEYQSYLRKVDNKIICNSEEIEPNLYFFDYSKL
jgi:hypothetical protein